MARAPAVREHLNEMTGVRRRENPMKKPCAQPVAALAFLLAGAAALTACGQDAPAETTAGVAANAAASQAVETVTSADNDVWALDPAASRISFVSIKAGEVAEIHRFRELEGAVDPDGKARIVIPLDSVETNIDLRNERMREMLFETADYPQAIITGQFDLDIFRSLAPGARTETDAVLAIDLHGVATDIDADLFVTRLGANRVSVETVAPIVIEAYAFNLEDGVERLREAASLPAITPLAPVTASLVFVRAD